jgi:hypothetical protein
MRRELIRALAISAMTLAASLKCGRRAAAAVAAARAA